MSQREAQVEELESLQDIVGDEFVPLKGQSQERALEEECKEGSLSSLSSYLSFFPLCFCLLSSVALSLSV